MTSSGSRGRAFGCPIGQSVEEGKASDDIRGLILTNTVVGCLSFVRRAGPLGLSFSDQIVPAFIEVLFNFLHTG